MYIHDCDKFVLGVHEPRIQGIKAESQGFKVKIHLIYRKLERCRTLGHHICLHPGVENWRGTSISDPSLILGSLFKQLWCAHFFLVTRVRGFMPT